MKKIVLICDNDKMQLEEDVSPPSELAYAHARVHVDKMTVLLPKRTVALHHKKGVCDSHAMSIQNADFCNIECLLRFVEKVMNGQADLCEAYHPTKP